tara:strand:- start:55 stop:675 length:621 start_codon:yes stop_codon:yes gene_type:complete
MKNLILVITTAIVLTACGKAEVEPSISLSPEEKTEIARNQNLPKFSGPIVDEMSGDSWSYSVVNSYESDGKYQARLVMYDNGQVYIKTNKVIRCNDRLPGGSLGCMVRLKFDDILLTFYGFTDSNSGFKELRLGGSSGLGSYKFDPISEADCKSIGIWSPSACRDIPSVLLAKKSELLIDGIILGSQDIMFKFNIEGFRIPNKETE